MRKNACPDRRFFVEIAVNRAVYGMGISRLTYRLTEDTYLTYTLLNFTRLSCGCRGGIDWETDAFLGV
jgi:hypothetical protein